MVMWLEFFATQVRKNINGKVCADCNLAMCPLCHATSKPSCPSWPVPLVTLTKSVVKKNKQMREMILIIDHGKKTKQKKKTRVYVPAFNLFDGDKDVVNHVTHKGFPIDE